MDGKEIRAGWAEKTKRAVLSASKGAIPTYAFPKRRSESLVDDAREKKG